MRSGLVASNWRLGTTYKHNSKGQAVEMSSNSWLLKMAPIVCPEVLITKHQHMLRYVPEGQRPHLQIEEQQPPEYNPLYTLGNFTQ
jgi:hypothetical protein